MLPCLRESASRRIAQHADRAASVPTTATVDTNQGKRRKRKSEEVGRIGSVAMPTEPEEIDTQVTKAPCLAAVSNLNGHITVSEEVTSEEVNEELSVCATRQTRVLRC
jgi:hypothetical protein